MKHASIALPLFAFTLLAACSGAGSTGTILNPLPQNTPSGLVTTTTVLQTATLNGAPAFVTPSGLPVYTWDNDTVPNQSLCTGNCLVIWPAVPAVAGALPSPWGVFRRSDNGTAQLSYKGKALYTFHNDLPFVAAGDGIGRFHLARP